tara:strand:+ start:842 stop:1645 length:804 start_codon:yes stop_codon:yes gene_type:complete
MVNINDIISISKKAGNAILDIYNHSDKSIMEVEYKSDNSPLTKADKVSNEIICSYLKKKFPNISILSEEGKNIHFHERKNWDMFWLIDPIDGTKEFIKKNGEFTVNIALIEKNTPILGVVYAPVLNKYWYGSKAGSFVLKNNKTTKININKKVTEPYKIVASRSHKSQYLSNFLNTFGSFELINMGSSLKICLVAEGKADIYPRLAPTMEWDTAAAHAVLKYAHGTLLDLSKNKEMSYNKENLRNSFFIANSSFDLSKIKNEISANI